MKEYLISFSDADGVYRSFRPHEESASLECAALFLSHAYREQMPVGFETDARNPNDVSYPTMDLGGLRPPSGTEFTRRFK